VVAARVEGRDRVRKEDLSDHAVLLQFLQATLRVPVAISVLSGNIGEGVFEAVGPLVELGVQPRGQVVAVLHDRRPGVTVDGEDDIPSFRDGRGIGVLLDHSHELPPGASVMIST